MTTVPFFFGCTALFFNLGLDDLHGALKDVGCLHHLRQKLFFIFKLIAHGLHAWQQTLFNQFNRVDIILEPFFAQRQDFLFIQIHQGLR
mgnify:CR=1 FL=1